MESLFPNIDKELSERNMSYRQLAKMVGLSDLAMYRRLVGSTKWSLHEAIAISWLFNGLDVVQLFEQKERS